MCYVLLKCQGWRGHGLHDLVLFTWKNSVADSTQHIPMSQVVNRCDWLIDDGSGRDLWILKGSQLEGPFDSKIYAKAAFGGAVYCRMTHGCTTLIAAVKTRMQLDPAKHTSFICALASALSPPKARVLYPRLHSAGLVQVRWNGDMEDQVHDGSD